MNSFNDLIDQFRDSINTMPMQSRAIAVMLIAVILIGVGLLVQGGGETAGTYLFAGRTVTDDEIRKAEIAFGQASLRDYEFIGNRIKVPSSKSDEYLRALSDASALPPGESSGVQNALNGSNLLVPNSIMQKRIMAGKELDLAAKIMQFPEVKKASVFHDIQEKGFVSDRQQSASVVVVPHGSDALSPYTKKRIQDLVKAAYVGMNPNDVTVTDINGYSLGGDPWIDENNEHYRTKLAYERDLQSKITQAVSGYGFPQVVVDVQLDPKLSSQSTEVKIDPTATTLEENSQTKSKQSTSGGDGGVPGVASNAYGNTGASIEPSDTSKEEETSESTKKIAGTSHTQSQTAGLVPIRASVIISLRSSFYDEKWKIDWLSDNPDKTDADVPPLLAADRERLRTEVKNEIETAVMTIVTPLRAGDDASSQVTVLDYPDLAVATVEVPASQSAMTTWLANSWQSIAMIMLALVALFVARGALKSTPSSSRDFAEGFGLEIPIPDEDESEAEAEGGENMSIPTLEVTGANLKDELNSIVENNPDAAANVLRAWLSDAA